jgi:ATP-binding cassette subfamily B protein
MAHEPAGDWVLYRRLLQRARPFALPILGIFGLNLLATPIALLTPLPLALAIDSVFADHALPSFLAAVMPTSLAESAPALLLFCVALYLGVQLLKHAKEIAATLLRTWTGERLVLRFRSELFRYIQRLSLSSSDSRGSADALYRIQYDAIAIRDVAIEGVIPFVTASVSVAAMLYVTARIDAKLALVAFTVAPALFLMLALYRRRLRRRAREVKRLESSALGVVGEVLSALRVVKAFGQEDREHDRFADQANRGLHARLGLTFAEGAFALLIGMVTAAGAGAILWIGGRQVLAGSLTVGELVLVWTYLAQLYDPLRTMSKRAARLQTHLASAERAFALLDEAPDVEEHPNARRLGRAAGRIEFDHVRFAYEANRPILEDISFAVPKGSRVGITGPTGAGKTTLVGLLTRFHDPSAGAIRLDGIDLREYRLADLRNQFGIVLQEPVLFSTSIAENIAYARPDASESEIVAAARSAGAHEFIAELPDGYQTSVGERGMRLSGGERQRIALARAFLKDAPILILDEPTSSVDTRTEQGIIDAMERLARQRTTFIISHREETLARCDVRLEIDAGEVVRLWEPSAEARASEPVPAEDAP